MSSGTGKSLYDCKSFIPLRIYESVKLPWELEEQCKMLYYWTLTRWKPCMITVTLTAQLQRPAKDLSLCHQSEAGVCKSNASARSIIQRWSCNQEITSLSQKLPDTWTSPSRLSKQPLSWAAVWSATCELDIPSGERGGRGTANDHYSTGSAMNHLPCQATEEHCMQLQKNPWAMLFPTRHRQRTCIISQPNLKSCFKLSDN